MPLIIKYDDIMSQPKSHLAQVHLIGNRVITALMDELRQGTFNRVSLNGTIEIEGHGEYQYFISPADLRRFFNFLRAEEHIANKISTIELTNCNIEQSDALEDIPLLRNLTVLNLKDNLIQSLNFEFAPNLKVLDVRKNFIEHLDLTCCPKLSSLFVGSRTVSLQLPATQRLSLEVAPYGQINPVFSQWVEARMANPSLNVNPQIRFSETKIGHEDYAPGAGDEEDDGSDQEPDHTSKRARSSSSPKNSA